jgi:hypothetical protein
VADALGVQISELFFNAETGEPYAVQVVDTTDPTRIIAIDLPGDDDVIRYWVHDAHLGSEPLIVPPRFFDLETSNDERYDALVASIDERLENVPGS